MQISCRLVVKVALVWGRLLQHLLFCSFPTHWSTPSRHSTRQMLCSVSPVYCLTDFLSLCLSDSSLTVGSGPDASTAPQKLLILDARSYTAAVANRAKGGGCECEGKKQSLSPHTLPEFTQGTVLLGGDMLMHSCAVSQSSCHAVKTSKCSGFFSACLMFSTSRTGRSERVKGLANKSLLWTSLFACLMENFLAAFTCRGHAIVCWIKPAASPSAALPPCCFTCLSASHWI